MASNNIDTKSLADLIAEFRLITAKDAITPDSLGYILQRIADLLASVGTSETAAALWQWYTNFRSAPELMVNLKQGTADPNHIYLKPTTIEPISAESFEQDEIQIQQATTERAGAMRASQVTTLNTLNNRYYDTVLPGLTELQSKVEALQESSTSSSGGGSGLYQIGCEVVNGWLYIYGAAALIQAGYVPYLFRFTRRRNRCRNPEKNKGHSVPTKGWHLYGSRHTVKIQGNTVLFSENEGKYKHKPAESYTSSVNGLISLRGKGIGSRTIPWGRSVIKLWDKKANHERMLRLRFAIGFAPLINPGTARINVNNLVSNLAEFSVVYNPNTCEFSLSR